MQSIRSTHTICSTVSSLINIVLCACGPIYYITSAIAPMRAFSSIACSRLAIHDRLNSFHQYNILFIRMLLNIRNSGRLELDSCSPNVAFALPPISFSSRSSVPTTVTVDTGVELQSVCRHSNEVNANHTKEDV